MMFNIVLCWSTSSSADQHSAYSNVFSINTILEYQIPGQHSGYSDLFSINTMQEYQMPGSGFSETGSFSINSYSPGLADSTVSDTFEVSYEGIGDELAGKVRAVRASMKTWYGIPKEEFVVPLGTTKFNEIYADLGTLSDELDDTTNPNIIQKSRNIITIMDEIKLHYTNGRVPYETISNLTSNYQFVWGLLSPATNLAGFMAGNAFGNLFQFELDFAFLMLNLGLGEYGTQMDITNNYFSTYTGTVKGKSIFNTGYTRFTRTLITTLHANYLKVQFEPDKIIYFDVFYSDELKKLFMIVNFSGTDTTVEQVGISLQSGEYIIAFESYNGGSLNPPFFTTDIGRWCSLEIPLSSIDKEFIREDGINVAFRLYGGGYDPNIDYLPTTLQCDEFFDKYRNISNLNVVKHQPEQVNLSWTNPPDSPLQNQFNHVKILRKTGGFPSTDEDGTVVYDNYATTGTSGEYIDTSVSVAETYYYTIFAYFTGHIPYTKLTANQEITPDMPKVSGFTAIPQSGFNQLAFDAPAPANTALSGIIIRVDTNDYPASATTGTLLTDQSVSAGEHVTYNHLGANIGIRYYYSAFAYSGSNYSEPLTATATPFDADAPAPNSIDSISVVSSTQINMVSETASDSTPPVQYMIDGMFYNGSSWSDTEGGVSDLSYTTTVPNPFSDNGLSENGLYKYRQKVKDGADHESSWSTWKQKATLLSNPIDDDLTIINVTSTSLQVVSTEPQKPSGVGQTGVSIDVITGESANASDRGFVDSYSAQYTSLSPNTQYGFKIKYRNYDGVETLYNSTEKKVYTLAAIPGVPSITIVSNTSAQIIIDENGNPATTEYAIKCLSTTPTDTRFEDKWLDNDGTVADNEGWATKSVWDSVVIENLSEITSYTFAVIARNNDEIQTVYSGSATWLIFAKHDSDNDGMPDIWEFEYDNINDLIDNDAYPLNPYSKDALSDNDNDGEPNLHEWVAGTNPLDSSDLFKISKISQDIYDTTLINTIDWSIKSEKSYQLYFTTDLLNPAWQVVPGQYTEYGDSATQSDSCGIKEEKRFYKIKVW